MYRSATLRSALGAEAIILTELVAAASTESRLCGRRFRRRYLILQTHHVSRLLLHRLLLSWCIHYLQLGFRVADGVVFVMTQVGLALGAIYIAVSIPGPEVQRIVCIL